MRDLTNELTVFVIVSGNDPNFSTCIQSLNNQSCKFTLEIIKNYSPMSKAFQEMLYRVKTSLFIQCDSDMILNENTIEKMWCEIEGNNSQSNISMHCYKLRDCHLNFPLYGIKIYKSEIFKKYPFIDCASTEVEQLDRMKKDGYDITFKTEIVGEHCPHWTNESIFERYYNLMNKFFLFHYSWMETLPKQLFDKVKKEPTDLNIYALAGCLAGVYTDNLITEEKDFTKKRKEYGRVQSFLEKPHQLTLYVGNICNFKCEFCFRQHSKIEQSPDMTPELTKSVIDKFPEIKSVCLCGFSETLTSKNLIPILQVLKKSNKYVGLITNGSLLTKRINEFNDWWKPDYISVSLNASNKALHEKITHTKTWDNVLEGIRATINAKIECYISSVVSLENINDIPNLLKLANSLGIQTVHLHNLLPHFSQNADNTYFWNNVLQTQHQYLIDELKKLPEFSIVKKWPILIDKSEGKNSCKFPWYSFSVNGAGNISLCNSVLPADKKFGNINDFSFWNSNKLREFREKFCNKELPHCKICFRNFDMNF